MDKNDIMNGCTAADFFNQVRDEPTKPPVEDVVNHPSHYVTNGIECIDAMIASQGVNTVIDFCACNAFKYIWRCTHKGKTLEDLQKAQWYLNKAINLIQNNETY